MRLRREDVRDGQGHGRDHDHVCEGRRSQRGRHGLDRPSHLVLVRLEDRRDGVRGDVHGLEDRDGGRPCRRGTPLGVLAGCGSERGGRHEAPLVQVVVVEVCWPLAVEEVPKSSLEAEEDLEVHGVCRDEALVLRRSRKAQRDRSLDRWVQLPRQSEEQQQNVVLGPGSALAGWR